MHQGADTPAEAVDAWMSSTGHRANILTAGYTYFGGGVASKSNYKYWVQMFTSGGNVSSVTGSTGSLTFASVEEMESAYLICTNTDGYTSYLPLDTAYMTGSGSSYTLKLSGKTVTLTVDSAPTKIAFTDVPAGAYYADAVAWAVEQGITAGTSETTFSPDMTCTRGQVVTFLWRAQGKPEPTNAANPFTDVKESDYYYKAVLWAVEQGLTVGTSETTFSPDMTCTSGQVITFLYRSNNAGAAYEPSNPYYANAVAWAEKKNLLSGTATVFAPDNDAPRSDIVVYLYRNSK